MFKSFYEKFRPTLGDVEVCLTDTDSFLCAVRTPQSYEEMLQSMSFFLDFSNYDKEHPMYNTSHQNQLSFWKDECKGERIEEMAGIRSKGKTIFINCN